MSGTSGTEGGSAKAKGEARDAEADIRISLKPTELFEAMADIVTQITKRPFREQAVTAEEYDAITDKILRLAEGQKKEAQHEHNAVDSQLRVTGT